MERITGKTYFKIEDHHLVETSKRSERASLKDIARCLVDPENKDNKTTEKFLDR